MQASIFKIDRKAHRAAKTFSSFAGPICRGVTSGVGSHSKYPVPPDIRIKSALMVMRNAYPAALDARILESTVVPFRDVKRIAGTV
jgi:hypothetical protein